MALNAVSHFEPSSLLVMVAQPDERHAKTSVLSGTTDTKHITSGSNEED